MIIKIHNAETGEIIEREMNAEELAQVELDAKQAQEKIKAKADEEAQRKILLNRLGITEDEARLLLGGN